MIVGVVVETEMHMLFQCTLYEGERWSGAVGYLKDGMDEYELIKGYYVRSDEIEKKNNDIYESDVE